MGMERHRLDLLPECNGTGAPIDLFTRECCANCFTPECTRSLAGKLKFDQRVSNWEERLFLKVQRMDPSDPRYPTISAQKFITIDTGRVPEINTGTSEWVDPRQLVEPPPPVVQTPPPIKEPEPVVTVPLVAPVEVPAPVASADPTPTQAPTPRTSPQKRRLPKELLLGNTPSQSGKMVGQPPPAAPPPPARDPWATPESAPKSDIPVVPQGARIKMGGGGV